MTTASVPTPIDPFALVVKGLYRDPMVEVHAAGAVRPRRELRSIRTAHFDVQPRGATVRVDHSVPPERIDDDLAGLLADELFGPGWLRGSELFERIFTGIVLTSADDAAAGWELFYRNTMARVDSEIASGGGPHGTIGGYAPVYAHAEQLLADGDVLELGCCFGFLSLRLAQRGRRVVASDVNPGTVALLSSMAPRLGIDVDSLVADAARVPAVDLAAGTVLVVHLLEHLDPEHGERAVREAMRLASRRVVVGVPLEEEADETWGHVRTISMADLAALGRSTGWVFDVHEHHGGWLVLDRP